MKTNLKKFTVMTVAIAACGFAACKKEQSANQNPASASVSYTVTDRLQVNNEDGRPRPLNTLAVINDEAVAIESEALSRGHMTLKNTGGADLLFTVVNNAGGKLTLAQNYAAADGLASGTVYYALNSN